MPITARGTRWEILHSLWIAWTFTLFLYSVAFFYIGFRTDQRKWTLWGLGYSAPFIMFIVSLFVWGPTSWQSDATGIPALLLGVVSIGHAFKVRGEYLLRLDALSRQKAGRYTTSKTKNWEKVHLLWIGWTFTIVLNWVAFLYIGFRARQPRWILWGLVYLSPLVVFPIVVPERAYVGTTWGYTDTLQLLAGVASIIHAFVIRKEYLQRLEALPRTKSENEADLKRRIEAETLSRDVISNHERVVPSGDSRQTPDRNTSRDSALTSEEPTHPAPTSRSVKPLVTNATDHSHPMLTPTDRGTEVANAWWSGDELDYQISSSYPFPIAFGFRSLMSIVDYRDLYREQLRIAENILAFLASVSLTLLQEQDRHSAGINPEEYWRSGISPGDWKDIVGRCSKVFATYEDNPLALGISGLNIRSEKKGFGHDVAKLIQAKNDYKHDRGPTVSEDIAEASREVQERLKRCMEKLSFFSKYPIRQVEDFNVSRSGNEFYLKCLRYMGDHPSFPQEEVVFRRGVPRGDLFLELDRENWVPLYPFILPMTCSHCKARETYFVDLWDLRRGTARMKSFERGHTMTNTGVSKALVEWNR